MSNRCRGHMRSRNNMPTEIKNVLIKGNIGPCDILSSRRKVDSIPLLSM